MDFTIETYKLYLTAIKQIYSKILLFREFIPDQGSYDSYCLIRHDVVRKPISALNMARVESELGMRATYYFRTKKHTFQPKIIQEIADLGHEIGYHYENLADTKGDYDLAIRDFEANLERLRQYAPVSTIAMHGRPLQSFDNRDLWREAERKTLLREKFNILGEVYLDIDYQDIAYINDTGRNWTSKKRNRRDKVESEIQTDFESGEHLLNYLRTQPHQRMVFQIHPERWAENIADWGVQYLKDAGVNLVKSLVIRAN